MPGPNPDATPNTQAELHPALRPASQPSPTIPFAINEGTAEDDLMDADVNASSALLAEKDDAQLPGSQKDQHLECPMEQDDQATLENLTFVVADASPDPICSGCQ